MKNVKIEKLAQNQKMQANLPSMKTVKETRSVTMNIFRKKFFSF